MRGLDLKYLPQSLQVYIGGHFIFLKILLFEVGVYIVFFFFLTQNALPFLHL